MKDNRLSYLRAFSTIAIVFLHTAFATVVTFNGRARIEELTFVNTINNITMWAVPCFVMITGSLLLDRKREISYKKLFKVYILRIVVLLITFSFIYRFFDLIMSGRSFNIDELVIVCKKIFTATGWSHLWYLYMLISLYLLIPFFKKFTDSCEKKDLAYFLGVNIVFLSFIPMLKYWGISTGFYIQITTIYTFYLFAGYAIYQKIIKISKIVSFIMILLGLGASMLITYLKWTNSNGSLDLLNNYFSLIIVVQSLGIFNLFVNSNFKLPNIIDKALISVDKNSLGIYLIHMIFVRYIFKYTAFNPFENLGVSLIVVIGIISISYILTLILKLIPVVKKFI